MNEGRVSVNAWIIVSISQTQYGEFRTVPEGLEFEWVKTGTVSACGYGGFEGKFCGRILRHEGCHIDIDPLVVNDKGVLNIGGNDLGPFSHVQKAEIIGLAGVAQSGKDTCAGILAEFGYERLAFADILRQSVYNLNCKVDSVLVEVDDQCLSGATIRDFRVQEIVDDIGWDRAKVKFTEVRELLQRMGTEVGRELYGENFWVEKVMQQMKPDREYVITDARFPNEVQAIHDLGGRVYRIERDGTVAVNSHISDTGVAGLPVDGVVTNNGTVNELREQLVEILGISA